MVQKSITLKALRFIFKDVIFDIIRWPFWWYSGGIVRALKNLRDTVLQGNNELALTIWLKNIFVPMFGDYSWQGRIISFFMRLVQLVGRFLFFIMWCFIAVFFFLLWIIIPVIIVYEVLYNAGLVPNVLWMLVK